MKVRLRTAAAMIAASLCLSGQVALGQAGDSAAAVAWYTAYQRDSRLVPLPGARALNLYCMGTGSPTVILESGIGGSAYDWRSVQARMAVRTRVCAYDRAGTGRSPAGQLPRDTRAEVADLEALLRAANLPPPYVLVGHSMGGYNVRLFASRHPRDVAGLVLVDPSVEDQIPRGYEVAPAVASNDQRQMAYLRACADTERSAATADRCTRSAPAGFPPDLAAAYVAGYGLSFYQTVLSEAESFLTLASWQVRTERRHLGAMPLIILTRGERSADLPAEQAEAEWDLLRRMHGEVASLSTAGVNRVVSGAGHYVQIDRPDAVIEAVGEIVASARRQQP